MPARPVQSWCFACTQHASLPQSAHRAPHTILMSAQELHTSATQAASKMSRANSQRRPRPKGCGEGSALTRGHLAVPCAQAQKPAGASATRAAGAVAGEAHSGTRGHSPLVESWADEAHPRSRRSCPARLRRPWLAGSGNARAWRLHRLRATPRVRLLCSRPGRLQTAALTERARAARRSLAGRRGPLERGFCRAAVFARVAQPVVAGASRVPIVGYCNGDTFQVSETDSAKTREISLFYWGSRPSQFRRPDARSCCGCGARRWKTLTCGSRSQSLAGAPDA